MTEIATAIKLLNLISDVQSNMQKLSQKFRDRFDLSSSEAFTSVRNGILLSEGKGKRRSINKELVLLRINSKPIFDSLAGFRMIYSIGLRFTRDALEASNRIFLGITEQTPIGDDWSISIAQEIFETSSLELTETKIAEWLQTHLEHATSFNAENPLIGTVLENIYPRIRDIFVQSKWNEAVKNQNVYEQYSLEFLTQFENEVNAMRYEVYALEKAQGASS